MPVRALVAAGEVFRISSESVRVALVRLLARGTVERNERGQYRIAPAAEPIQRHVVSWTHLDERLVPWRSGWVAAHTAGVGRSARAQTRRGRRALHFLGLRELAKDLWVRPDNLKGGVAAVRAELHGLGLDPTVLVFGLEQLDEAAEPRAHRLWDAAALRRSYAEMGAALDRSAQRLGRLPAHDAMVESFLLGGQAIRLIVLDPLLPEPIIPSGELAQLVDRMRRYDRLGRDCWKPFMTAHDAPHLQTPRSVPGMENVLPA